MVIDRLMKRTITVPTRKSLTSKGFADLYYDRVWPLYGFPKTMVSNKGAQFTSVFTDELSRLYGVKQKLSTAGHL